MSFLVEDGTGLALATSYVSVIDFEAFCDDVGTDLSAYTELLEEQALVRATQAVDVRGLLSFVGTKKTSEQALAWPREDAVDVYGFDILSTVIPKYVKNAVCYGAIAELAIPSTLQPTSTRGGQVQEERVEGAVTVKYFPGAPSGKVYTAYLSALSPVLKSGGTNGNIAVVRV